MHYTDAAFASEYLCGGPLGGGLEMRFGAGIWLFGQFVDRYATDAYGPAVSTIEAIQAAGSVGALAANDISAWCITPHIYTRDFRAGAFTNPDPKVRAQALDLCEQAVAVAK